ncbi:MULTISPECIES: hypothetical protein [Mycolicibacterium]|uniref:ATP-dependent DNA ligase n=1 Tax=Mycolicibacterium chlorophenolicum TaxID=37916 RepID=A0A0J6W3W6_9MYCO|nr:hypothetical protein [Mycolicibacterium chlorophenolicum]KMO77119.1 ATP-dependent DNA ligase [Mycolicibacterium chlorophenolicum]
MNVVNIRPMLVTAGKPPRNYADFAIEVKYYRQRGVAIFDGEAVTLLSRNGANITRTARGWRGATSAARHQPVNLDGDIVAPPEGIPCFSRLQRRLPQNRRPAAQLLRSCRI